MCPYMYDPVTAMELSFVIMDYTIPRSLTLLEYSSGYLGAYMMGIVIGNDISDNIH